MKRILSLLTGAFLIVLASCASKEEQALLSRDFPTMSWERFDYIDEEIKIEKPTTYDLVLNVSFDTSYKYNYFEFIFSVYDDQDNLFRAKEYKFRIKENDSTWESNLVEGTYDFSFPINNELTFNEPGTYKFRLESKMPITPLLGIKKVAIFNNKRN